jgi:hypothetical protein
MCAVQEFAGQELNRAVVKPEARAILSSFDDFVNAFRINRRPEQLVSC